MNFLPGLRAELYVDYEEARRPRLPLHVLGARDPSKRGDISEATAAAVEDALKAADELAAREAAAKGKKGGNGKAAPKQRKKKAGASSTTDKQWNDFTLLPEITGSRCGFFL